MFLLPKSNRKQLKMGQLASFLILMLLCQVRPGRIDDWKSEQLFVPPLPPTNLRGCHMIRIQYDVFVSIYPSIYLSIGHMIRIQYDVFVSIHLSIYLSIGHMIRIQYAVCFCKLSIYLFIY